MSLEGYRFSRVTIHAGRRNEALKLDDVNNEDALTALHAELLKHLKTIKLGNPMYLTKDQTRPPEIDVNHIPRGTEYFFIQNVELKDRTIFVEMCFGLQSELDYAMDAKTGRVTDMSQLGGVRIFRILFHVPKSGIELIMVSEVVGKGHAGMQLLSRISKYAQFEAVADDLDFWPRWKPRDVVDPSRADTIIKDGNLERIRLRQDRTDPEGRPRDACIEYTTVGLSAHRIEPLKEMIRGWIGRAKIQNTEEALRREGVADACKLLELGDSIPFDRVEVTFVEKGKQQTVSPEKLDDLYVYPIGDRQIPNRRFIQATDSAASSIANTMGVQISLANW